MAAIERPRQFGDFALLWNWGFLFAGLVFGAWFGVAPLLFTLLCLLSFAVDWLLGDPVQSIHSSSLCPSSLGDPVQSFSFISPLGYPVQSKSLVAHLFCELILP